MSTRVGMGANKKVPNNNDNEVKKLKTELTKIVKELEAVKAEKEKLVKELEAVKIELEEVTADKK